MKPFSELSKHEIDCLSPEEWANIKPSEKRSCYDCKHLKSALSWWCTNKDAINVRGTSIPGCIKCHYWEPRDHRLIRVKPLKLTILWRKLKRYLSALSII